MVLRAHGYRLGLLIFLLTAQCRLDDPLRPLNEDFDDGANGKGPSLAVIGDSLSTGVVASTTLGGDVSRDLVSTYIKFIFGGDHTLEATQAKFSEYRNSSITTDEDWGMRGLIAKKAKLTAKDVPIYFSAQWGGRLLHVEGYLEKLRIIYTHVKPADNLLVLIGGNDFCRDFTAEEFATNYERALHDILAMHASSTVYIGFVPPVYQGLRHTSDYTPTLSCNQFRKWWCPSMYSPDLYTRYAAYNRAIAAFTKKAALFHAGDIHVVDGLRELLLERDSYAYDCFHPSLKGHHQFADAFADAF